METDLSVKEAARILGTSEQTVRNYVSSGKLPAKRKGRQLFIPQESFEIFMRAGAPTAGRENPSTIDNLPSHPPDKALQPIIEHISSLESKLDRFIHDNQRLVLESKHKDENLTQKDLEIEKLQRDLIYQKRLFEKELEDQKEFLEEKWKILQEEIRQRIDLEKKHFEEKLRLEQDRWSQTVKTQEERHAQELVEIRNQEGFWSKLIKMMTWS